MKHSNIVLGLTLAGTLMAGCVFNEKKSAPAAASAVEKAEPEKSKDIALAKFMFKNPNGVKAFEIFRKYAEKGDTEAEAWLGRCYMSGIGTAVDHKKAFEYFSKAAAKNHPYGINGLGVCKQFGYGTDIDLRAAIGYYKKAADMGFPLSILNLARTYSGEFGGFFDGKLAEEYFKKAVAAKADGANALYAGFLNERKRHKEAFALLQNSDEYSSLMMLAECYENGYGVKTDIRKAISLIEKANSLPDKENLGVDSFFFAALEETIINGPTDFARKCFKAGAELEGKVCLHNHALILKEEGLIDDAIKNMVKASDKGYDLAMLEAGKMLKNRNDIKNAVKYLTMATLSSRTRNAAIELLCNIYHDIGDTRQKKHWSMYGMELGIASCRNNLATEKLLSGKDENIALAAAWSALSVLDNNKFGTDRFYEIMENDYNLLRTLADKGNGNALYALGVLGIMNQDMKHPDIAIGIELLEKAVKQNSSEACILLGHIHRAGKLVPRDMKKALEYYRKGAEMGNSYSAWWVPLVLTNEKEFADTPHDDVKKAFERCLELNEDRVLQNYGAFMEFTVKDLKKAEELYRLAAAKGDTAAMLRLYHLLSESNPAASLRYLFNAIELEDPRAETEFADHLFTVNGRPRDIYGRYLSAYWHGDNVYAPVMLATCYLNGFGCEPNSNMFWKFSDIAYKNGSADICLALGDVFRDGKIIPKNLKKAREYYTEGVKRGNQSCRKALDSLK